MARPKKSKTAEAPKPTEQPMPDLMAAAKHVRHAVTPFRNLIEVADMLEEAGRITQGLKENAAALEHVKAQREVAEKEHQRIMADYHEERATAEARIARLKVEADDIIKKAKADHANALASSKKRLANFDTKAMQAAKAREDAAVKAAADADAELKETKQEIKKAKAEAAEIASELATLQSKREAMKAQIADFIK